MNWGNSTRWSRRSRRSWARRSRRTDRMGAPPLNPLYSIAEYLQFERTATEKHEYHDGEIVTVPSDSPEHSFVGANTITALGTRLRGSRCRLFGSDLRIAVQATRW